MEPNGIKPPPVGDEVLTVQEVAKYLKVTTKTVYDLIRQGSLPSFRVGRAVRCRESAVEAFIEKQLQNSATSGDAAELNGGQA